MCLAEMEEENLTKQPPRFNVLASNNSWISINKRISTGNWNIQTVLHTQPYKLLPSCAVWEWNGQQGDISSGLWMKDSDLASDCQQQITSTEILVHTAPVQLWT